MQKRTVGVGLVGAGFMGRCHANAFRCVSGLFELELEPRLALLADATDELAQADAAALGFPRATTDWQALCADGHVDIVAVTAPNALHEPVVMAAIEAGKTVYCEKPLSTTAASARRMTEAAERAGIVTLVGFNFLRNPMIRLAREIVAGGEIGEVTGFRGRHAENSMADPDMPHSFRTHPEGGGALADIGSHIISLAQYLVGPITEVAADCCTIHALRPVAPASSERAPVEVDDMTHALIRFESGASGRLEANWAATARTMDLSFEITGTGGAVSFTQERMNELLLWSRAPGRSGYTRIEAGPAHPPYGRFCPAPGHHLGFDDRKVIEVADLLEAVAGSARTDPDFREALAVQETIEAMQRASAARSRVGVMAAETATRVRQ